MAADTDTEEHIAELVHYTVELVVVVGTAEVVVVAVVEVGAELGDSISKALLQA